MRKSFNPRLPRGKATEHPAFFTPFFIVSIHAFREGRRRFASCLGNCLTKFQSTPSAREGDELDFWFTWRDHSFNPRLPRGKATQGQSQVQSAGSVSIHAFREGRRPSTSPCFFTLPSFQSTPSAREGDM